MWLVSKNISVGRWDRAPTDKKIDKIRKRNSRWNYDTVGVINHWKCLERNVVDHLE